MKRIIIPAILMANSASVLAYSNLTKDIAAERAQQVGDVSYKLSVDLKKKASTFTGTNLVTFKLLDNSRDVVLDFDGKLVSEVIINGKPTNRFTFDSKDENIVLPKQLLKKGKNTVSISFEANFSHHGAGLHQYTDPKDGNVYLYTDFEAADSHRMFPNFDQPSIKAHFTLDVEAPDNWQVVSNMPMKHQTQAGGRKHSYFDTTKRIASYIMHLSAGPYAVWQDDSGKYPMRIFARQSLAKYMNAEHMFDTTKKGLAVFEKYYDFEYPFTKYDQLFVPEFNAGAMENAGAVTFTERLLFRTPPTANQLANLDVTILHEMAHMWFGDLVTMQWWNDLWLNESFADFMGYEGLEGVGNDTAWEQAGRRKGWAYFEDQLMTTHPILSDIPDILSASANFDGITYAKGLAALRQLQYYIGEDQFREGIRRYFKKHAFGNTTLKDFISALESAHGAKLTSWVNAWLGTKDVNSMKLSFDDKGGKIANAKVYQQGGRHDGTLRPHANLIGLYYVENGELKLKDKVRVTFDGKETALTALDGKKTPAIILPNVDDYDYVKIRFDDRSMAWLKGNMDKVKDPATKTIIWRVFWDMVRDREMKVKDYTDMALAAIADEQDVNVLGGLTRNLNVAYEDYVIDEATVNADRNRIFKLALEKARGAKPGSDLQRVWYGALLESVHEVEQYNFLADLYDGKQTIKGIDMIPPRKWTLLILLAQGNRKDLVAGRMEALLKEDNSASSQNSALEVDASYPLADVKEKVWKSLTEKSSYSLLQKRFIGNGLYNKSHPELAKTFIDRYFKQVEAINKQGKPWAEAAYFIRSLYPELGMEQTVVATEQFLQTSEVPKTYKKLVMKSLDELKRTIAIRKANL